MVCRLNMKISKIWYLLFTEYLCILYVFFYYYHFVYTSTGGLLVPKGFITIAISASVLTWFIRYISFTEIYSSEIK